MNTPFLKKIFFYGTIETKSGLHISSYNDSFSLGILDYTIIRDSITQQPFIPGSSIKGKMRTLLKQCSAHDADSQNDNQQITDFLFGAPSRTVYTQHTRVIFRDAYLTKESVDVKIPFADLPFTEIKKETYVDRHTGRATPTLIERVPAGLFFSLEIILTIYEGDDEQALINTLLQGLHLLQDDYLGGRGSRGYGVVKFHISSVTFKDKSHYLSFNAADQYDALIPETLI
ncbi:type III-A CRISPR-associated RAMP protein Csm3 [bacterium]|nr:type III-A CRISPR-associated RAMP protein Csm3 [bacterium]